MMILQKAYWLVLLFENQCGPEMRFQVEIWNVGPLLLGSYWRRSACMCVSMRIKKEKSNPQRYYIS